MPAKNRERFEILRQLGQGGMGQVYLARDRERDREVALKCLLQAHSPQAREVFREEVKILAGLKHPNLVQIYDYFEIAGDVVQADGEFPLEPLSPCFTMEYVPGTPLQNLPRPLPEPLALPLFTQLSEGLVYLHHRRILHRDLKPSNALQTPQGTVKLLDFGLATTEMGGPSKGPVGTLAYLPPEAFWGEYLPLSDLFSFGAMFYELLTDRLPYPKPLSQTRDISPPPPLQQLRGDLPEALATLVDRLLRLSPGERPPSAQALLRYLPEHGVELPTGRGETTLEILERLPLVARQQELKRVESHFNAAETEKAVTILLIQGPTGIGRSRFLEEVRWFWQLRGHEFEILSPEEDQRKFQNKLGPRRHNLSATTARAWTFQDVHHFSQTQLEALEGFCRWKRRQQQGDLLFIDWNTEFGDAPSFLQPAAELILPPLNDSASRKLIQSSGLTETLAPEISTEIIHHSGGRPLLLLEALRQAAQSETTTWQAPKDFTEAARHRVESLKEDQRETLAVILAPALPPHWEEVQELFGKPTGLKKSSLMDLQEQNFLEGLRPGHSLELITPSLKPFFWQALDANTRKYAHRQWLEFWSPNEVAAPKPSRQALAITHHARELEERDIFKTWALEGAETWVLLGRDERAEEIFFQYAAWANTAKERYLVQAHLAPFYYRRGEYEKSLKAYDLWIADRDDDESRLQQVKHHFYTGLVYFTWGREDQARDRLGSCLQMGKPETFPSHRPYLARSHLLLGRLAERRGELAEALAHYRQAGPLAENSSVLLGEVEVNLGRLQRHLGKLDAAKQHFSQAQGLYHKGGNLQAEAIAFHSLGLAQRDQGDLREALHSMEESLRLSEASHALVQEAVYQANTALLHQDLGDYGKSRELLRQAQNILAIWGKAEQKLILKLQQTHQDLLLGNRARGLMALKELNELEETLKQERLYQALVWLRGEAEKFSGRLSAAYSYYRDLAEDESPYISFSERLGARIAMASLEILCRKTGEAWSPDPIFLKTLEETGGPLYQFWFQFFAFFQIPFEERDEVQLRNLVSRIKVLEFPEMRKDLYHLLAKEFAKTGLTRLAARLEEKAWSEWKTIYHTLPEESKMDYEKNRSLSSLDEDLEELLPGKKSKSASETSGAGKASGQISEQRFRQLTEINRQIGKKRNLEEILERVMDASIELTGAERGFLVLKNPDAQVGPVKGFEVKTARHLNQGSLKEKDFQFSMTAVQEAIDQGSFVLTDNAQMDDRFQERQSVMQFQLKAILTTPLEIEGDVLGAIYLDHRFQPGCFSEEDVVVLSAFAAQAALAIEKAQILEELNAAKQQLEKKVETQAKHIEDLTGKLSQVRADLRYEYGEIIGQSPSMMRVFQLLDHVTETTIPVWIWGESGTGKELIARSLHFNSARKSGPFVSENCSAIPETLLESELFGHKKGAFTHADRDRQGLFEQASGGTLFLDEIGDMSIAMQAKLLRVLQEGEVRPVGSNKKVKVDVRLVTASHKDLNQMVTTGKFRQDLFYRVNGLTIILPPLRERLEDIPLLSQHLMKKAAKEFGLKASELTDEAFQVLYRYSWPGNIRELEGTLRNALLFAKGRPITPEFLNLNPAIAGGAPQSIPGATAAPAPEAATSAEDTEEKQMILDSLRRNEMNKNKVAEDLGISLRTLYSRMEKLGIPKKKSVLMKYIGVA